MHSALLFKYLPEERICNYALLLLDDLSVEFLFLSILSMRGH